jgi:hypothetical protein
MNGRRGIAREDLDHARRSVIDMGVTHSMTDALDPNNTG